MFACTRPGLGTGAGRPAAWRSRSRAGEALRQPRCRKSLPSRRAGAEQRRSAAWPSTACFGEEPCTGSAAVKQEQDSGRGTARAKAAFLQQAGDDYGYGGAIDSLRRDSLARLRGRVYVDHAGAALYCEDQLRAAVLVRCEPMTRALDSGCLQARAPLC